VPRVDVLGECPIVRSFRVDQVAGMFDLELAEKARVEFSAELPAADEDWRIGAIVGPSGSGKSSIARAAFGRQLYRPGRWPRQKAVIDGFGEGLSVKQIVPMLTAVGFSSPPAWVKPYHVLSNGEQFRCDLARALLGGGKLVAFDEFTSVVDRTVAKIGSAAVAKAIRKGRVESRFVAVTCHYDVLEWLQPDWTLDLTSGRLARGCLRRPPIELTIAPVHRSAWSLFRRHHYLSGSISGTAYAFAAFWGDRPVGFAAWVNQAVSTSRQGRRRLHRIVVLPDFQGVGIGGRTCERPSRIFGSASGSGGPIPTRSAKRPG